MVWIVLSILAIGVIAVGIINAIKGDSPKVVLDQIKTMPPPRIGDEVIFSGLDGTLISGFVTNTDTQSLYSHVEVRAAHGREYYWIANAKILGYTKVLSFDYFLTLTRRKLLRLGVEIDNIGPYGPYLRELYDAGMNPTEAATEYLKTIVNSKNE